MMAGMRQVVDPPSFTPTPYGLLTTVEFPPDDGSGHWQNGITYQPMCGVAITGVGASTYDANCLAVTGAGGPPPPPLGLTNNITRAPRGATSFEVYAEFDCAAVGNDQAQEMATRAIAMSETWQVERAFWTGIAGSQSVVFPHLAANAQVLDSTGILLQTAAINVTGAGSIGIVGDLTNVDISLGLLEGALANCYNGVGIIHVPEFAVTALDAWGLLKTTGAVMKTLNGNKVAVGAGYPGSGPTGAPRDGNTFWMYATGNVFCYRSPTRIRAPQGAEAFDRSTNTMKMIAERTYVLGWDCCHLAIESALGVPKGT